MPKTTRKGERQPMGRPPTHGHTGTRTYNIWVRMKQLCDYPKGSGYQYVGAKGVGYDPRWADFNEFLADMGEAPEGQSLKRLHARQDFSKANCEWRSIRKVPAPDAKDT